MTNESQPDFGMNAMHMSGLVSIMKTRFCLALRIMANPVSAHCLALFSNFYYHLLTRRFSRIICHKWPPALEQTRPLVFAGLG